ncbi:Vitamin B12 transporter BtuB [Usitatibacter rugosus]|uniref:Vitamin B12 transporter BtuB n=1 Tax=Usitatibacter rugosus TaxID=2732067 RepID=A0A6M4GXL9_9PROT|nr:TonB-dependent receptor [Usitatibacter rugosus]QJR10317.1 Vitamin B12 transporter BtuB [Usitatibacter rugosus]
MHKKRQLIVHLASLGIAGSVGLAPAMAQQTQKIEKIEVTGSNIKRIEGEGAAPVTVITREEINRSGVTTAAELLDKISANSGGGYNVSQAVGDSGTPGLAAASLRGLGSTNTLILLNGRRLSNYAFNASGGGAVNLNQIPLAAVDRVEVLKDGASAIYGTDAIGGVINFILRKDFTGIEASAYGTQTEHGGGNVRRYTGTIGFGDINKQRFNVLASFDYEKDTPLKASQRPDFAGTGIRPDLGFSQTSGNTWPANFVFDGNQLNVTARNGCLPNQGSYRITAASGEAAPLQPFCRQDFTAALDIYPPAERKGFFTRGALQFSNDHQAFVEYHYSKNEITFGSSETPVNDFNGTGPFLYPAGGRYYPTSFQLPDGTTVTPTGDLPIAWRLKSGGLRTNRADTEESRLVAGLQGVLFGWDYNTAFSQSISKATDNYIDGFVRESLMRQAIASGNVDVFSGNPLDAAGQALIDGAKILEQVRKSEAKVTSFDGKISKELMEMKNGAMALAVGFDTRKEELDDQPAAVLFSGDILGGGGAQPPTRADRRVTAFFGELNIPLLKNLEAQVAIRYDDYSDFGSTTNPKVALRWTPTKETLVRASYSTGFRAPTLSDMFLPNFLGNTADTHNDPIRCPGSTPIGGYVNQGLECDAQFQNQLGGNRSLTPEKSKSYTVGAIWEPNNTVSLGADYWDIRRRNSIGALGDTTVFDVYGAADPLTAGGLFVRTERVAGGGCRGDLPGSPTPASVPCPIDYVIQTQQNLGKYNVNGVDFTGSVRFPAGNAGQFTLRGEGTYILKYRYQNQADGPYLDNNGAFTADNGAIPRWRHYVTLNWKSGPWGGTLGQNFVLGYTDSSGTRRVGSYETWDLQGTWDGWRGLGVVAGIRNVLDRDPPASDQGQTFQVGYDPRYTDSRGRTYYVGLKYAYK